MADTERDFLAFPTTEGAPTVLHITVGVNSDDWTSPGTGTPIELMTNLLAWANGAGRAWFGTITFSARWAIGTAGALATLIGSGAFSLAHYSGDNALQLPDVVASSSSSAVDDAAGSWMPALMKLPPLLARVGEGPASRSLRWGGPLRVDATPGTTVRAATLQAFCDARTSLRLSGLIAGCIGGTARATYVADTGTETELLWEIPEAAMSDAVVTITMPIRKEV